MNASIRIKANQKGTAPSAAREAHQRTDRPNNKQSLPLAINSIPKMKDRALEDFERETLGCARLLRSSQITPEAYTCAIALMRFEFFGERPSAWSAGYAALTLLLDPDSGLASTNRVVAMLEAVYKP